MVFSRDHLRSIEVHLAFCNLLIVCSVKCVTYYYINIYGNKEKTNKKQDVYKNMSMRFNELTC